MSVELNARNITALSNAVRQLREDRDTLTNTNIVLQNNINSLNSRLDQLTTRLNSLMPYIGGGPTHGN